MTRLALALALALALVSSVEAEDDVAAFLKTWAERMRGVRSLEVTFTQTMRLKILRKPQVSRGRVLLKEKRLLMVVTNPLGERETELAVDVEKGEVRLHYPKLRRLEVFEIGKGGPPSTPFPFFGGDVEKLPETYRVSLAPGEKRPTLVLVPRDPASSAGETRLTFDDDHLVASVRQTTAKGDVAEIEIEKFKLNPEVKDEDVELRVPEGTTVTRPFEGEKK
jgi:outer membrane lipoprotein-sorting protein